MDKILHDPKDPKLWELWYIPYYGKNATLRTLNYGNYGVFLIMGHAGFCPSTVEPFWGSRFWIRLKHLGIRFRVLG